jgi:biopolymer transport protein ExbD
MADIDVSGGDSGHKKGPGVKKAKKLSTRVDMTPMVDLGFLLITFFIFTTTMSTPNTMALTMPKDDVNKDDLTEVKESGALTIMLGKGNQVYYYEGQLMDDGSNFKSSNFKDIRQVIIDKKKQVMANHIHDATCDNIRKRAKEGTPPDPNWQNACLDRDLVVVIKPNPEATYKNTIDMLDEMTINGVKRFAMIDITPNENEVVKMTEAGNNMK